LISGDYTGALAGIALAVVKPIKVVDKIIDKALEPVAKKLDKATDSPSKATDKAKKSKKKKRKKSLRLKYLGRTPGKKSRTGKEVIARMRKDDKIRDTFTGTEFKASNGKWYPLSEADMAHEPMDAVRYWNTEGRKHGAKSKTVRKWMLDSNNYTLDHYSSNRSAGAKLTDRYLPPLKKV